MEKMYYEIKKENYERLKFKFNKLVFIDGIAIYFDPFQANERKYALVKSDGTFLFESVYGQQGMFVDDIKINDLGLFELNFYYDKFYFDKVGNRMSKAGIDCFRRILKSRTKYYTPENYYIPDDELIEYSFENKIDGFGWSENNLKKDLKFKVELNGLFYNSGTISHVGKDYETYWEEVSDNDGNEMSLEDFWRCFVMFENGKKYMEKVREFMLIVSV